MVGRRLRQLTYGLCLAPFRETYARSGATISNQIPRHEGELPPEIGGIERRAGGRGDAGRFKIRFERIASVSRPRLRRLAWCARRPDANAIAVARLSWTPKKHQSGEINYWRSASPSSSVANSPRAATIADLAMAALRRPRTEARPRRVDNAKRDWLIEAAAEAKHLRQQLSS
jgi:hypothetical protein